jgi:hypothetical protein
MNSNTVHKIVQGKKRKICAVDAFGPVDSTYSAATVALTHGVRRAKAALAVD